jgi:prolipoprotein diacylglyceryltransferase
MCKCVLRSGGGGDEELDVTSDYLFVGLLAALLGGLYAWGFGHLNRERWQFIGTIPMVKDRGGQWQGLNLTYYGLFNANACTLAVAMVYILLGASGLAPPLIHLIIAAILLCCVPAAKLVARWVEKKANTFSIGGAAFVGLVLTPWLMGAANLLQARRGAAPVPVLAVLAAVAIAYALGEGSGRLACISFGCCYGRPLAQLPAGLRRWLAPLSVVYRGTTKKIAYADRLHDCPVVAVQAITAVLYTLLGLGGILLYLRGRTAAAYLLAVCGTQIWRFASEFLRADYRGAGRISAYQIMSLTAVFYAGGVGLVFDDSGMPAHVSQGLRLLWNPGIILLCQILWIGIFLYMGRSQATGARISFHVRKDRI